jgi:hypothetical protein
MLGKILFDEKNPKLEKKHVRQAACQAAGRPGRSAVGSRGYVLVHYQLIKCGCGDMFDKALST